MRDNLGDRITISFFNYILRATLSYNSVVAVGLIGIESSVFCNFIGWHLCKLSLPIYELEFE